MIEENHEKTSVRLGGTGIWTQDLPNASLMRYHGATSLGAFKALMLHFPLLSYSTLYFHVISYISDIVSYTSLKDGMVL